jgi:hypothetical protein
MPKDYRRNCFKCVYFYITWDKRHPNGCKAMGFKTKQLPSSTVFRSSGKACELFKKKQLKNSDQT